uniref:Uncharacterized protein n=1 Tax=Anguilla anguilla TaxID=7936 RepID=A0A0E9TY05_ANGAN
MYTRLPWTPVTLNMTLVILKTILFLCVDCCRPIQ